LSILEIGKQGIVELGGARSTVVWDAPKRGENNKNIRNSLVSTHDKAVVMRSLGGMGAVASKRSCVRGLLNNKPCVFKIDTGSDVSVLSIKLAESLKQEKVNCNLKYPTGEKVPIISRVFAEVSLGKFCIEIPFYVANIVLTMSVFLEMIFSQRQA